MTPRELWSCVRYGSDREPAIIIDWDERTVRLQRMSARRVRQVMRWMANGLSEAPAKLR